eukprot:TRINITY_DN10609_c0_g1_i3.p2 TRINITY_DN10609_c0_g1~~TRINITY_DN10609_c0_g1_i3.p2  ORF type:complete len:176 (+),score=19.23 TRINITY_DN10609_c0_g1_i3:25-528(+)
MQGLAKSNGAYISDNESRKQSRSISVMVVGDDSMIDSDSNSQLSMRQKKINETVVNSENMVVGNSECEVHQKVNDLEDSECIEITKNKVAKENKNGESNENSTQVYQNANQRVADSENTVVQNKIDFLDRMVVDSPNTVDSLDNFVSQLFEPVWANLGCQNDVVQSR